MPPAPIALPKQPPDTIVYRPAVLHSTDEGSHPYPADEQTKLINHTTRRTLYTPPPASPTTLPRAASAVSPHSSRSPHLSDLEEDNSTAMDTTLLADSSSRHGAAVSPYDQRVSIHSSTDPLTSPSHTDSSSTSSSSSARWLAALRRPAVACPLLLTVAVLAVLSFWFYFFYHTSKPPPFTEWTTCDVFCTGPILAAYQMSALFNDSKTFVDLPLLHSPSTTYHAFLALPNLTAPTLTAFLHTHFNTSATDLLPWDIPDWTPTPPLLSAVADAHFRNFTASLNDLWHVLGRRIHPDVYLHPERHTLLPLRHDRMVVPGGRFREFYYWDTYWIVRGLLLCNMTATARLVVENLVDMAQRFGFVPNGSRQYYLTRSQPPFLALMVDFVGSWQAGADGGAQWAAGQLGALEKEYAYWMVEGQHLVSLLDARNNTHQLNRYYASVQYPRPESYAEDVNTARALAAHNHSAAHGSGGSCGSHSVDCDSSDSWSEQAKVLFSELTASAETGWDFSSRWFADRRNISTAETSHIIPVDLNAVMYGVERVLSKLHNASGDAAKGAQYAAAAARRVDAMYAVLFDADDERAGHYVWRDYDFHERRQDGDVSVLSNYIPLWTHAYDGRFNVSRVIDTLLASGLVQAGGLLTSLDEIGQQWDCPNAWPPLQHMVMEGIATAHYTPANATVAANLRALLQSLPTTALPQPYTPLPLPASAPPTEYGAALAYYMSASWLYGNALLFDREGIMYEKYYAMQRGAAGAGGEYDVQTGFGWTNGVALIMLAQYGSVLDWQQVGSMASPVELTGSCTATPGMPMHR